MPKRRALNVIVALALACGQVAHAAAPRWLENGEALRGLLLYSFSRGAERAEGVHVLSTDEKGLSAEHYLLAPDGLRFVISDATNYKEHLITLRFLDEEANWWAEISIDHGLENMPLFEPGGIGELVRRLREENPLMSESFETADGYWWYNEARANSDGRFLEGIVTPFRGDKTSRLVPQTTRQGAMLIRALGEAEGNVWSLGDGESENALLRALTEDKPVADSARNWKSEMIFPKTSAHFNEIADLLRRFTSISESESAKLIARWKEFLERKRQERAVRQ